MDLGFSYGCVAPSQSLTESKLNSDRLSLGSMVCEKLSEVEANQVLDSYSTCLVEF